MTDTIYIAPGYSQCRVYAIPGGLPKGVEPRDVDYFESLTLFKEIGLLNHKLELVCLEPEYLPFRDEIDGAGPGTYWDVEIN